MSSRNKVGKGKFGNKKGSQEEEGKTPLEDSNDSKPSTPMIRQKSYTNLSNLHPNWKGSIKPVEE